MSESLTPIESKPEGSTAKVPVAIVVSTEDSQPQTSGDQAGNIEQPDVQPSTSGTSAEQPTRQGGTETISPSEAAVDIDKSSSSSDMAMDAPLEPGLDLPSQHGHTHEYSMMPWGLFCLSRLRKHLTKTLITVLCYLIFVGAMSLFYYLNYITAIVYLSGIMGGVSIGLCSICLYRIYMWTCKSERKRVQAIAVVATPSGFQEVPIEGSGTSETALDTPEEQTSEFAQPTAAAADGQSESLNAATPQAESTAATVDQDTVRKRHRSSEQE